MSARVRVIVDSEDGAWQITMSSEYDESDPSKIGTLLVAINPDLIETHDSGAKWYRTPLRQGDLVLLRNFLNRMPWP